MKSSLLVLAAALALTARADAADPLKVVATIPDVADIVREVGGDRVEVNTLTRGRENLHAVTARPSHLVAMNRADVFVQVGLALETAFVPGLLEAARNARIRPGAEGFVNLSEGWEAIDVPDSLSRRGGDVHPYGNPHLNLDPRGGLHMASVVRDALVRLDPGSKAGYEARFADYAARLEAAGTRWAKLAEAFQGRKVVAYHQEFDYLARVHGFEIVATIESKPGIPPTPNHLAQVIGLMREQQVRVVLVAPWSNNRDSQRVAEKTGAQLVELPNQAGGTEATETWIGMMDHVHRTLAEALEATGS